MFGDSDFDICGHDGTMAHEPFQSVLDLEAQFQSCSCQHVMRKHNQVADSLTKKGVMDMLGILPACDEGA